jgi:DNA-binding SARP family transcriptional activator
MAIGEGIHARLLGPVELNLNGTRLALGTARERALLARLLLDANRTVSVDQLVDDLWGIHVPATAVKMIHVLVSRLRKLLPAGMLLTRPPGYALTISPEALDLVHFERQLEEGRAALAGGAAEDAAQRLKGALALWRGSALAEFDEPFAVIERRRLDELRQACLEDRIDADLAVGAHAELVGELDALVARHPLRERLHRQLMLALYRSGRQAEALAGYRRFRRLLSTEFGLEPSPELRELERRMLQQDSTLSVAAPLPRPAPPRRSRAISAAVPMRRGAIQRRTAAQSRRGTCTASRGVP